MCNSYVQLPTRRRQWESILKLTAFSNHFSHATEASKRKPGHSWLLISKLLVLILLLHICYITRSQPPWQKHPWASYSPTKSLCSNWIFSLRLSQTLHTDVTRQCGNLSQARFTRHSPPQKVN